MSRVLAMGMDNNDSYAPGLLFLPHIRDPLIPLFWEQKL